MDVPRVFLALLLLAVLCRTSSTLKNDRGGSSFSARGPGLRLSRRIALNEYLVPPPPPRQHPFRAGRLTNPQPTEAPGYFSKLMNWFNPFGFGSPGAPPLKPPPFHEPSFPPSPQSHAPQFNVHPAPPHPVSSLHPPAGPPSDLPLYPPLNPPPSHPGPVFTPPLGTHPVLPLSSAPSHPGPVYKPAPARLQEPKHYPPPPNKGRSCNPCNKVPWIPMQGGDFHPEQFPPVPQPSNGYPNNHGSHDAQHAASHDFRVPELPPHAQAQSNGQPGVIALAPNPLLQPNPAPPVYSAEYFGEPSQNPPAESFGLQPPPAPLIAEGHANTDSNRFNNIGNHDLTSSGTQINQGHANVAPENHGPEVDKEVNDHRGSFGASDFDNRPAIYGSTADQDYHDPATPNEGHGGSNQGVRNPVASFGASNIDNLGHHGFTNQNGDDYREPFESKSGHDVGAHYLPPDLNPISFGSAAFDNHADGNLNDQYSEDLSPSSSVVEGSRANASVKNDTIHFEESPLLDLSKTSDSQGNAQWQPPIVTDGNTVVPTTAYRSDTVNAFLDNSSSYVGLTNSYTASNNQDVHVFGRSTPSTPRLPDNNESRHAETSTARTQYINQQDVSDISKYFPLLLNNQEPKNESWRNKEIPSSEQGRPDSRDASGSGQKQQNTKRNKQVQVIIPYTSDYTPVPFQQSYGDWSVKNNPERTQPRRVPTPTDSNIDNYLQQESRNEIRLINQLQSELSSNDSYEANLRPSLTARVNDTRTTKANSSIDVRRLQKNIDNWTIQEYSKPTSSSTIVPSSSHPYLLKSKNIPTEYLTTTEPGDHTSESKDNKESVKSYSLGGFTVNEVDHEGSSSNHVESVQSPIQDVRVESSKSRTGNLENANEPTTEENPAWGGYSVTISSVNKEKIYVVTPQPVPAASSKGNSQKREKVQKTSELNENNSQKGNDSSSEFDAIEKAYQVLPQAVNNLAVASTGKEEIPLWGIMEHDEFAALSLDGNDDETTDDLVDGPVLYAGHSKVSRGKR
ncbi:uncharacterized protein LOC143357655 [Halictus rubicundus]|uniref:uncharacterized protein LOC143357655 n=1 Tax=Halictus rubicundus TaxID=77578 RepID=UPI00403567AF